ncbi:TRADD-N-associated membrane domain-containing protein [Streptomyces canus]|uniref:TRADD-N-associated membrane domain-containing protein n=1 Tax=Streptomyces canus TaxID=58343 RepID=UPI002DDBE5CF|nr:hypothetical protein [Streptomyces canus]WSD82927.1 hypothetical protein OG925_00480 [Streptomyces canus]WSD91908.1 hypothetical protein OG925_50000 [Streptomyces canus]WSD92603.1 hypothetical protein OG925_50960 [Streptomyces canus]
MDGGQLAGTITAVVGGTVLAAGMQWVQSELFDRAVSVVRRRLRTEVLGESPDEHHLEVLARIVADHGVSDDRLADGEPIEAQPHERREQPNEADGIPAPFSNDQRFAALLIEYYAYGLTQARRSFGVSLTCSTIGGLVLMTGIALAIFRADTDGQQYASITASVAGLLTTAIGTLFHRRADLALKHMESQTQSLRQDMKVERDAGQAIHLLGQVKDPTLKAHLQAALILKFSAATLPELNGVLKSVEAFPEPGVNGAVPHQQPEIMTP